MKNTFAMDINHNWSWCNYISLFIEIGVIVCLAFCILFFINFLIVTYRKEHLSKILKYNINSATPIIALAAALFIEGIFYPKIDSYLCGHSTIEARTCR